MINPRQAEKLPMMIMKAENRSFRFHPSVFILLFPRASPLSLFCAA
jgi:hypothetical protein